MTNARNQLVPLFLKEALDQYAADGSPPGGFLTACLENKFVQACTGADLQNQTFLISIALYIYNDIPSDCWGSNEKVDAWIAAGGIDGFYKENER